MSVSTAESIKYPGETISVDGQAYAYQALLDYESAMSELPKLSGNEKKDAFDAQCQAEWKSITASLEGTDYVYVFGSSYNPNFYRSDMNTLMYEALVSGYNPSVPIEDDSDFMWDEILGLDREHPEIEAVVGKYDWNGTDSMPIDELLVNGSVVPRGALRQVLGTLYDEGSQYKSWGYGYPNFSDERDTTVAV
jgi:hypothetical protein